MVGWTAHRGAMLTQPHWSNRSVPEQLRTSWQRLLADQAGVVSSAQLRMHGVSPGAIAANVKASRWWRVLPRVYATFTGELPRAARLHAAMLYGGECAALSHHTAAQEWGILPKDDRPVEITVPYTASAISKPPLVVVHRSRAIKYITVEAELRRTTLPVTITDLAVSEAHAHDATTRFVDLASRGRVQLRDLAECVQNRRPMRHLAAIKRALDLLAGGLMSALEIAYLEDVEQAHGLPIGRRQHPFEVDGKTLWEDVAYDEHGAALTVRLDGRRYHATPGVAFRDMRRDNAAELAGRARLVYGWHDVHHKPCTVAAEVRHVLHREGCAAETHEATCVRCSPS